MDIVKKNKRGIEKKWSLMPQSDSPGHKNGFILPPGKWQEFDPFLIMAEDEMKNGAFDYHPHRGIETITYIVKGQLDHLDNKGGKGSLNKGDAQWLTSGKGLLHLEEAPKGGFAHTLQLWLNLPAKDKLTGPRYQDIIHDKAPVRVLDGGKATVFSGSSGEAVSPTKNHVPVTMVEVVLETGVEFIQDLPIGYNGFIYIIEGTGIFGENKTEAKEKDVLWLTKSQGSASEIWMRAMAPLKILIIAGKPLNEPVAIRGPFVMNSEAELDQAYAEFRKGEFGEWTH